MSEPRGPGVPATEAGTATVGPSDRPGTKARPPSRGRGPAPRPRRPRWRPWMAEALVLAGFLAAGVLVTWPRAAYLAGRMPANSDQAQYVWNLWWVAHQLAHLGNPWFTSQLAAPVGIPLGFDTLMPLLGAVMAPVTLIFGPSASYGVLVIAMPGLASYAMYRLARLWLPGWAGPLAAGAFFGLSTMETFQAWTHLHTAAGAVFIPLTMEAAVRLRRGATVRRGVVLGVVAGASVLVDQEFAVLAMILAALLLIPWLIRHHGAAELRAVAAGAVTAVVIALPQLIAMVQEAGDGSLAPGAAVYARYTAALPGLFAPSPRLATYGMTGLASIYQGRPSMSIEGIATFGVVLTVVAVLGLAVSWRRRSARLLGLLWLGSAVLALGPVLYLGGRQYAPLPIGHGNKRMSLLMPYTWLIHLPGLSTFREADRLAFLGLAGAALLAGAGVEWLRRHAWPLIIVVAALGALEAGWSGWPGQPTMPTTLPAVDRPIAADHSGSIVVDVPYGILGDPKPYGVGTAPPAQVLATADGHPRAFSYGAKAVPTTVARIKHHAFYAGLVAVWQGRPITPAMIAAARTDLQTLHAGWVLVWLHRWQQYAHMPLPPVYHYPAIFRYLTDTGFHFDFQADGVAVYRP